MTPFEAIFNRKSVRHYRREEVPASVLDKIQDFDGELLPMFPYVKTATKVFREEEFGRKELMLQVKAPYYLAIYAQELEGYQENAGNMMQQISLYLHSKGIGSCFLVVDQFLLLLGNGVLLGLGTSGQGKDQRQGQTVYKRLFHGVFLLCRPVTAFFVLSTVPPAGGGIIPAPVGLSRRDK